MGGPTCSLRTSLGYCGAAEGSECRQGCHLGWSKTEAAHALLVNTFYVRRLKRVAAGALARIGSALQPSLCMRMQTHGMQVHSKKSIMCDVQHWFGCTWDHFGSIAIRIAEIKFLLANGEGGQLPRFPCQLSIHTATVTHTATVDGLLLQKKEGRPAEGVSMSLTSMQR
eukprot:521875-Pelagomonas_calceolata.AAC.3